MAQRERLVELRQEIEWRRCARNERYFLETYYKIRHPAQGQIPFKLRDAQIHALEHWEKNRYSLTLKARQIGWSELVAAHVVWLAIFHPDQNIILISRTERESVLLIRRAKYGYVNLPEWIKERGPKQTAQHQQKMQFANGSQIVSMPSESDPARGESASLVVVDEWAFLPNPEDAWASIEPVTDIGGRIIGLSTANGYGNFFHKMWVGATTGANDFKTMFFPWSAVPERDEVWYENKRRTMLSWQLAQEYPTTPEEAFIKSGRPVYGDELDGVVPTEGEEGFLDEQVPKVYTFKANLSGLDQGDPLTIWEHPQPNVSYVLGADVAEGLDHGDFSSAHLINVRTGLVAAHWHGHIPADMFGDELYKLGLFYNDALLGVEVNNHGLTTITALRRRGYPRLYRRRRLNSVKGPTPQLEYGWRTDKSTKPLMIDELGMDLRNGEVELLCGYTLAELRTYVRDEAGRTSGSPYDDRVVSLAITNQMRKYVAMYEPEEKQPEQWPYSLAWWATQGNESRGDTDWVIGKRSARQPAGTL